MVSVSSTRQLVIPRTCYEEDLFSTPPGQADRGGQKKSHYACQIHYHVVLLVKCRKALLADEVTAIIQETAVRDR